MRNYFTRALADFAHLQILRSSYFCSSIIFTLSQLLSFCYFCAPLHQLIFFDHAFESTLLTYIETLISILGIIKSLPVFGESLKSLEKRDNCVVPKFVTKAIESIEKSEKGKGMITVGIYR